MRETLTPDVHKPKFDSPSRTFVFQDTGTQDDFSGGPDFMGGHPSKVVNSLGLLYQTPGGNDIKIRVRDAEQEGLLHDRIVDNGSTETIVFRTGSPAPQEALPQS